MIQINFTKNMGTYKIDLEIRSILTFYSLRYDENVIDALRAIVENMAIKLLADAYFYKENTQLSKTDIQLAIILNADNANLKNPLISTNELVKRSKEINRKEIRIKTRVGVRIPRDNLGNVNYQVYNPIKRIKLMEQQLILENQMRVVQMMNPSNNILQFMWNYKNFNNSFTLPNGLEQNNSFHSKIQNNDGTGKPQISFTIRPKFNIKQ